MTQSGVLFEARTPLASSVRVSQARWELIITVKHPVMAGRADGVKTTLEHPDEVRQSRTEPRVLLFYREGAARRWVCAVTKKADADAFWVTAYPTDAIKGGAKMVEVSVVSDREGRTLTVWFSGQRREHVCEETATRLSS